MNSRWLLEDVKVRVCLNQDGSISVTDKRIGKEWNQMPPRAGCEIKEVKQEEQVLSFLLYSNDNEFEVSLELTSDSEALFTILSDGDASFEKLEYPPAFAMPNEKHCILQTDGQGVLLSADDLFYPTGVNMVYFCGGGPAMSWIGVVDEKIEAGYMAIIETPFDAAIDLNRDSGLLTFAPVWVPSMGKFSYERKIRYVFFDKGGYVSQCKRYRNYIWEKNNVTTLKEKAEQFPDLHKMLGAAHIYIWDNARNIEVAKDMKASGIEKAMLLWDANHYPYPSKGFDLELKELGYATGAYDLFSDILTNEKAEQEAHLDLSFKPNVYPGLFEEITSKKADGSKYSNEFGTYVCPEAVRPEMEKRVSRKLADYPHETFFVDVYTANGLYECYDSRHPLSRSEYEAAIRKNSELLQSKYKVYLGGEFGAEYGVPYNAFFHGMMTLQRNWFDSEKNEVGTIYYGGDWKNNPRPSIMIGTYTASETYLNYCINEYTRIPLYELVYHDAVTTSWRWEDGNSSCPEIWWKKDLFNVLYGTSPLWSLDKERWEAFRKTFVSSYQNLCPWLEQICYDEMLSHRFISENRKIQESIFSSGKKVVVNFDSVPYDFEGQSIPAKGYIIL